MIWSQHDRNCRGYQVDGDQEASFQVIALPILNQVIYDTACQIFAEDGGKIQDSNEQYGGLENVEE